MGSGSTFSKCAWWMLILNVSIWPLYHTDTMIIAMALPRIEGVIPKAKVYLKNCEKIITFDIMDLK